MKKEVSMADENKYMDDAFKFLNKDKDMETTYRVAFVRIPSLYIFAFYHSFQR